jgi:hypothetical protein
MKRLAAYALIILAFNAESPMASAGSGSIEFGKFVNSDEQDFIRRYVAETPYHQKAASYKPIEFEEIGVEKFDLNDDGVDELILNFELSSYYCGTAGCQVFLFRKVKGAWQPIGEYLDLSADVTDEKDDGWRRIRTQDGSVMRWRGDTYK